MRSVYCSGSFLAVQLLRAGFVQGGHEVIEIETVGSYLEYRFRTVEEICL